VPTFGGANAGCWGTENIPVQRFQVGGGTSIYFIVIMPQFYVTGDDIIIVINWLAETDTTGNVAWRVNLSRLNPGNQNMNNPVFSFNTDSAPQAVPGTAGVGAQTIVTITGSALTGIQPGDQFALSINRLAGISSPAAGVIDFTSGEIQAA
jgi:hypothetical protein